MPVDLVHVECCRSVGPVRQACRVSGFDVNAGHVERLRQELVDEQVWVPADPDVADALLAELDSAASTRSRRRCTTLWRPGPRRCSWSRRRPIAEPRGRRRRASFRSRGASPTDARRSSCEYWAETTGCCASTARTNTNRRWCTWSRRPARSPCNALGRGWVRLATPQGVATWDGIRWAQKPLSPHIVERITPMLPDADPDVLANLVELCNHWLGAGRIGTAIVWRLDGDAHQLDGLGFRSSVDIPPLDLTNRSHLAPLLNALSQYDRAALVDGDGHVTTVGVHLRTSEQSRRDIPPFPRHPTHVGAEVLCRCSERRGVRGVVERHPVDRLAGSTTRNELSSQGHEYLGGSRPRATSTRSPTRTSRALRRSAASTLPAARAA